MIDGSTVHTRLIDHRARTKGTKISACSALSFATKVGLLYGEAWWELPIRRDLQKPTGVGTQELTAQLKSLPFQL
jgi:hypothetical protein